MTELTIISGKGGTGKTSVTASFAALAENAVFADCDVDAANMHLVMEPEINRTVVFAGGKSASIETDKCIGCGKCFNHCRYDAIKPAEDGKYKVTEYACEGCGVCAQVCPVGAVKFEDADSGEWYVSDTRFGTMVHAKLYTAAENSGKLVSEVRTEARKQAEAANADWLLVDGPPGIGCPVIASITGTNGILVVTEPTVSGMHDLERVLGLAAHFDLPAYLCVNKWDLNEEMTENIEKMAAEMGCGSVGRIRYDNAVTSSQVEFKTVIEYGGEAAEDIKQIWCNLKNKF